MAQETSITPEQVNATPSERINERTSEAALLNPVFVNRWSPRSFTTEPISDDELTAVFEAARWSPSCFNTQPWRYVYETEESGRQKILDTFMETNRLWAQQAPVAGFVIALTQPKGARSRDFDAGAATMAMTIQATMLGLYTHLMAGIHIDAAHQLTSLDPEKGKIICGFVIGRRGNPNSLPDFLRQREHPNSRKPLSELVFKGTTAPSC